jgi:dihydroorotate dehydrogenase (fumarate)
MATTNIGEVFEGINFKSCITNASGCWCTKSDELSDLVLSEAGGVICKSGTVKVREGNSKPRLHVSDPYGSINSMGVPNLGYQFYTNFGNDIKNKPYIQSLIPFSHDDLKEMLTFINNNVKNSPRMVEVNLSCPNLIKKSIVGLNFDLFREYAQIMQELETPNLILGIKLPPYYQNHEFDTVSEIVLNHPKIRFVTCINSVVNGLIIDVENEQTTIHPKNGYGGIGGIYCRPTALANVNHFYKRLQDKVHVIGCGGVESGKEVFAHILAGASLVEVGTQLMKDGPKVFSRLNNELKEIMERKGYKSLNEFRGMLKVLPSI